MLTLTPTLFRLRPFLLVLFIVFTLLSYHDYVLTVPRLQPASLSKPSYHQLPHSSNLPAHQQDENTPSHPHETLADGTHDEITTIPDPANTHKNALLPSEVQKARSNNPPLGNQANRTAVVHGRDLSGANLTQQNGNSTYRTASLRDVGYGENQLPATKCLSLVVYDKPMKTGSTAVTQSLKRLLASQQTNTKFAVCDRAQCQQLARAICDGRAEPEHLLQHMDGEHGLLECLREKGYYVMTSIREPFDRWESAYFYNKREQATHYGISWNESYDVFMDRFPACALLKYYDGGDPRCKDDVEKRIRRIVARYDEIVDLYDEPKGQVERLLQRFVGEVNESPRSPVVRGKLDPGRMENESKLYEALKERRVELNTRPTRVMCEE